MTQSRRASDARVRTLFWGVRSLGPATGVVGHSFGARFAVGRPVNACAGLVTMFFARYLPPELATNLATEVPDSLEPPDLVRTPEQEFFAGGFLGGIDGLGSDPACAVTVSRATERLLANRRARETHSLDHPCAWMSRIASQNRRPVSARPARYHWCDLCFPSKTDG